MASRSGAASRPSDPRRSVEPHGPRLHLPALETQHPVRRPPLRLRVPLPGRVCPQPLRPRILRRDIEVCRRDFDLLCDAN